MRPGGVSTSNERELLPRPPPPPNAHEALGAGAPGSPLLSPWHLAVTRHTLGSRPPLRERAAAAWGSRRTPGGGPCIFPKRFGARHQEAAAIRLPHGEVPGGICREDGRGSAARPVGARTGDTPAGRAARPQHQPGRPAHGVGPLPRGPRRRLLTRTRPAFMSKPVVPRSPPAPRLRSGSPRHVYASRPGFSFLLLPFSRPDHRTLFSQCEKLIDRDFCELVLSALKRVTTGFDFWFLLIF